MLVTICSTLFTVGNVLYLIGYSVRDILYLRILTVIASFFLMPFYFVGEQGVLLQPIIWTSLFILINLVQIGLLLKERRPVSLNKKELLLYKTIFATLSGREFKKLLSIAEWKEFRPGDSMMKENAVVEQLLLVISGRGLVEVKDKHIANIVSGQFIGEMSFLTEEKSSAKVLAKNSTEVVSWPVASLRSLLDDAPTLHLKVQSILGTDLATKLKKGGATAANPSMLYQSLSGVQNG